MWPFTTRRKELTTPEAVAEAITLAAERWAGFCAASEIPSNINLRDRVPYFAGDSRREMGQRFPLLKNAPEELVLLIIAEGIEQSGLETRRMIELQLGIVLPGPAAMGEMASASE